MRALVLTALLALVLASPVGAAGNESVFKDMRGAVHTKREKSGSPSDTGSSLPTWSSSFAYGGTVFPYTMVGSSPFGAPRTSTVPTVIVPLDVTLEAADPGAEVRRGSSITALTLASPVFQAARFKGPSYSTQYGNAMQKDMFWATGGSNPGYNVLLRNDAVYPTRTLSVPAKRGTGIMGATTGVPFARVDYKWFSAQVKKVVDDLNLPAGTLPIVLTENIYLYDGDTCCVFGLHAAVGNGGTKTSTYVYATWTNPALFSPRPGQAKVFMSDVHVLSHEIEGWLTDPFVNNVVPAWTSAFAPQYGCATQLDSTDPLINYGFEVRMPNGFTYHPQEPAFFSWFARETPSRALNGLYSYSGTLAGPATGC